METGNPNYVGWKNQNRRFEHPWQQYETRVVEWGPG
jgi:hypothetical protein